MATTRIKLIVRLAGYGIMLLPLVYIPWLLFPLTFAKVVVGQVLVAVAVLAALVVWLQEPDTRPRWNAVWLAMVVFLAMQLVSAVFGVHTQHSLWGEVSRPLGVVLLFNAFALVVVYSSSIIRKKDWDRYLVTMGVVSVLVIGLAVVQRFIPDVLPNFAENRVASTLGNPIFYAGYLLLMIIPLFVLWRRKTKTWQTIVLSVGVVAALVTFMWAQSRGATVGLLVVLGVFASAGLSGKLKSIQRYVQGGVVVGVVVIALIIGLRNHPVVSASPLGAWVNTATLQTRVINWNMAIDGFMARPVFGWGPGNYREVVAVHFNSDLTKLSFHETFVDKPHNMFLEVAATSGSVGLLAYLGVWVALGRVLWLMRKQDAMGQSEAAVWVAVGAGYAAHLFFLFETASSVFVGASIIAWLLWRYQHTLPQPERSWQVAKPVSFGIIGLTIILLGYHVHTNVISAARSAYQTNMGIQYMYANDWVSARDHFFAAYALHTPYVFERWRKPAEAAARFVFTDSVNKSVEDIPIAWRDIWISDQQEISAHGERLYRNNPNYNNAVFLGKWYYQTAVGLQDQDGFDRAEELFIAAHKISPAREEPLLLLTQLYIVLDRVDEAVATVTKAIAVSPEFGLAHWFAGSALLNSGDGAAAVDSFMLAIEFGFSPQISQYDTAVVELQKLGMIDEIVKLYAHAVETRFSDHVEMHQRLAVAYATVGDIDSAKAVALSILDIDETMAAEVTAFIASLEE